ncbi:hypothetical protein Ddye_007718 [Dipteronia dyeriana]|uniref:Uncharacterized protein n=1 Tax=Dipteronia dyeriana TaxID=168575 RepID=A0AAD9XKL4_9ROSI|nr:hypothetical protein Ddye_007718 [Dipteronia dyeriana]
MRHLSAYSFSSAVTKNTQFQDYSIRRSLKDQNFKTQRQQNEHIWWPPQSVLELARLVVDSGGDPDAIYRAFVPTVLPVPDDEGCTEYRCALTMTPYGRRFISQGIYLNLSVEMGVSSNRYDLFHGHLLLATESGRLGILFHAREYPAYDKYVFRTIWVIARKELVLVVLDAHPDGSLYQDIIPEYVDFARTIYKGLHLHSSFLCYSLFVQADIRFGSEFGRL